MRGRNVVGWGSVVLAVLLGATAYAQPAGTVLSCPGPGLLTLAAGQSANGDSANWLDVSRRYHAIELHYLNTGTSDVTLLSSIDNGVTFQLITGTLVQNANARIVLENPIGILKGNVANRASGTVTIQYMCGASAGGRP